MASAESSKYRFGGGDAATGFPQALLRRKPGLTLDELHAGWIEHARKGIPWARECGMSLYVQILHPRVADPNKVPVGVRVEDYDVAVELLIPENAPGTEEEKARCGAYFERVIVPDECRYFVGPNRDHAVWVPPGTVTGERIEIIKDGEFVRDIHGHTVIDFDQSTKDYETWKEQYEAGKVDLG